jgi:hypothetical protein
LMAVDCCLADDLLMAVDCCLADDLFALLADLLGPLVRSGSLPPPSTLPPSWSACPEPSSCPLNTRILLAFFLSQLERLPCVLLLAELAQHASGPRLVLVET